MQSQQQQREQVTSPRGHVQQIMTSQHQTGGANSTQSRQSPRMSFAAASSNYGGQGSAGGGQPLSPSAGNKRRGSKASARQSAMSHFSQQQHHQPTEVNTQPTTDPSDHFQQQEKLQQRKQQAKSGRIGIFGNYLASRISSFQQQKFLLNSGAAVPGTAGSSNNGANGASAPQQAASQSPTAAAMGSTPLQARKISAQQAPLNDQIILKQMVMMNATTTTVTNGVGMPTATNQQDVNMPANNSFIFGASNFGSVSTNDGHNMKPTLQKQMKNVNQNQSPFSIQGKPKQIVTRAEQEAQAFAEQKKFRKDRRDRTASQNDQAIALLPMVRRDYNAAQTFDKNSTSVGNHALEQTNQTARQSFDNLRHARVRQAGNDQFKNSTGTNQGTSGGVSVGKNDVLMVSSHAEDQTQTVNKSYQGNLTKLLRQVHLSEIEQRGGENRERQIFTNSTKQAPQTFAKSGGQVRGIGFYNSANQSQIDQSTCDVNNQSMRQQNQHQQQQNVDKRHETSASPDIVMGSAHRGQNWTLSKEKGSKNSTTATQSLAIGQDSSANYRTTGQQSNNFQNLHHQQQFRGHSLTPADELLSTGDGVEGSASPKQTRRPGGMVRSYDNSAGSKKNQILTQTGAPVSRDSRMVQVSQIYMGPELPGVHDTQKARYQMMKNNNMSLASSTSQVITEAQLHANREEAGNKHLAMNSKLNAALRHNVRPGLGPCLNSDTLSDERQVNMIDKIWGRFNASDTATASSAALFPADQSNGVGSQKKLPMTRDGRETGESKNQAVSLIKPSQKGRLRNDNIAFDTSNLLSRQHPTSDQPRSRGRPNQIDVPLCSSGDDNTGRYVAMGENTPVWLPKKDLIVQRNPNIPYTAAGGGTGSKSQAIENIQTVVALHRATDEQFDYKDFNFIVAKQRQQQQQQQAANSENATYMTTSQNDRNSRSNSPINQGTSGGRYGDTTNMNSESKKHHKSLTQSENNYYNFGGVKKRKSIDLITASTAKLEQLDNTKQEEQLVGPPVAQRFTQTNRQPIAATDSQLAYSHTRPSQKHLFKTTGSGSGTAEQNQQEIQKWQNYNQHQLNNSSQRKKNQKHWPLPNANSKHAVEELMPKYHVTIQIDPSAMARSPQNAASHLINKRNVSPQNIAAIQSHSNEAQSPNSQASSQYQFNNQNFNVVRQQAVPVKQHVIPGLTGHYQVGSSTLVDPNANSIGNYFDQSQQAMQQQMMIQRHNTMQGLNSAQIVRLNNNGVVSPKSIERRNLLVFSPEPKLIELPGEEARMKTLPLIYPIIPKRQHRAGKGQAMSGQVDERAAIEFLMAQVSNRAILGAENFFAANGDPGFRMMLDPDSDEAKALENNNSSMHGRSSSKRQQYLCPYASSKIQKLSLLRDEKSKARENGESTSKKLKKQITKEGDEGSATEESKDTRTAEQKAEDLRNHQRELLRKFVSKFPPKRLPNIHAELEEERMRFMRARKDANRKYTEISANNNKPGKMEPLKFVVLEGNNGNIVRRVMQSRLACNMPSTEISSPKNITTDTTGDETDKQRPSTQTAVSQFAEKSGTYTTWQETNAPHLFNFKWKPTSNGINYERLGKFGYRQLVNHIEGHGALTTKDQLFLNMKSYCEKKNLDVYDMIPLTFAVDFSEHHHQRNFDQILQIISLFEKHINLSPTELNIKMQAAQIHLDKVVRSPLSIGPSDHQGKNLWLLKPTGFNRGIGIHVFNSLDDLKNILWTHYRICTTIPQHYRPNNPPQSAEGDQAAREARDREIQKLSNAIASDEAANDLIMAGGAAGAGGSGAAIPNSSGNGAVKELKNSSFIVQKYIEAPLLFRKRKFDIRIWALISHDMRLYCFKEAYVRTSSEEYDLSGDKLDQVYVHLTNNSVQKYSKNYGAFEEGNIVSVTALSQELSEQEQFASSMTGDEIESCLNVQMRDQIKHSYEAVRSKLKFNRHTFELVGYDFMVVPVQEAPSEGDSSAVAPRCSFKTRLIEANTNPCFEESNQLLKQMVPRMLDDMLKIVMDPLFCTSLVQKEMRANETETGLPVELAYPVDGYADNINMFDLLTNAPQM